jgi:ankyrin repeat protein
MGNSPLHFACMLEKSKHAELLLEYGAVPNVRNEHGQSPLDLLPRDAVRSTKLHFKRIFEVLL